MEESVSIINIIDLPVQGFLSAWTDIEICRYHQRQCPIRNYLTSCVLELKPSGILTLTVQGFSFLF